MFLQQLLAASEKRWAVKAGAFVATLALVVSSAYALSAETAARLDLLCSYWLLCGLFGVWLLSLGAWLRHTKFSLVNPSNRWLVLVPSLTLTAALFSMLPRDLKILTDEGSLVSVSRSLDETGTPVVCTAGEHHLGRLECLSWRFDKRPRMFPFLVHLAHRLTGYRVANALAVNFAAGVAILAFTGAIAFALIGRAAGVAAPILLACVPIVGHTVTSGSFEPVQLAFLLFVTWLWILFYDDPDPSLWTLLISTHALMGHVRYEGFVYAAIGLPVVIARWRSEGHRSCFRGWATVLAPLALLPLVLHWRHQFGAAAAVGFDRTSFSWRYFVEHTAQNLRYLFSRSAAPNSSLIATMGSLSILLGCWLVWRRQAVKDSLVKAAPLAAAFILCWVVTSAYFGGNLSYPNSMRYALPLWPPLSVGAAWVLSVVAARVRRRLGLGLPVAAASVFWLASVPAIRTTDFQLRNLVMYRERRALLDYLANTPGRKLVIYPWTENLIPSQVDAWSVYYAKDNAESLRQRLASGDYAQVLFAWGLDCDWPAGPTQDPYVSYAPIRDVCAQVINRFKYRRVAQLPLENLSWLALYELFAGP